MATTSRRLLLVASLLILCLEPARGQGPALAPLQKEPLLRVEAGGPMAFVTTLAFGPDGKTLYAAGFDKVVRTWAIDKDDKNGKFVLGAVAHRVPVGPGTDGTL